jgi:DNA-binding transcriptional LysR family regulator
VEVLYDGQVDMLALAAPDHPLARAPALRLADLSNYPLALPTRDTTLRQVFDAACALEGLAVEPVLTANKLSALLPFVRRSRGLALMSALSVTTPLRLNELVSLPIHARASLARGIQVQAMRDRRLPRAVRAFLRQLLEALPPPVAS